MFSLRPKQSTFRRRLKIASPSYEFVWQRIFRLISRAIERNAHSPTTPAAYPKAPRSYPNATSTRPLRSRLEHEVVTSVEHVIRPVGGARVFLAHGGARCEHRRAERRVLEIRE